MNTLIIAGKYTSVIKSCNSRNCMSENSAGPWPCAYPGNHVYRRQDFAARANNHEGQELIEVGSE